MNRREHFLFECDGAQLAGTIDHGPSSSGLLIVTGGNELRSGPWGSQAQLAERIAASGFPVMRFDRRGVGDSEGENAGFTGSAGDIEAALRAFRSKAPGVRRIVAFGNCDAASALMLAGGKGCNSLVLANPWTFEPEPEIAREPAEAAPQKEPERPMPPSAIRAHYMRRLTDPRAIWRLLTGKVAINRMASSLVEAARPDAGPTSLTQQMGEGLNRFAGPVTILLAERDRTAQAFLANWNRDDPRLRRCPDASHSFVEPQARIWLQGQLLGALRGA
jgi:exosortase A-associated hydrolase 1